MLAAIAPAWVAELGYVEARSASLGTCRFAALESDPVVAGREALGSGKRSWYDADTDAIRRVDLREPFEFPAIDFVDFKWSRWFAWATIIVLLFALIAAVVYALLNRPPAVIADTGDAVRLPGAAQPRSELLPVRAGATALELREEAQAHFAAGRYGEAVVCLYSFGLLTLDHLQLIHLQRGKTNRQYLREAARTTTLRDPMRQMIDAFESYFFGGHDVTRERCQQCWMHVEAIQGLRQEASR